MRRVAFILLLAACTREPTAHDAGITSTRSAELPAAIVMPRHGPLGIAVRDAIANGDRADTRGAALALARLEPSSWDPETVELFDAMRAGAVGVAEAKDARAAAVAFGAMVETCASCHARRRGPTMLDVAAAPARAARHGTAAERLWNGLVFNSEPPWNAGASVLGDPTLRAELGVSPLAVSVRDLGVQARATSDTRLRARIYGQFLATCDECHQDRARRMQPASRR